MKEMTLKEVQQQSLVVLKVVHDHCVKNNLRYSLAGGSLIGAVRHKGFIPWDDDIDIIMPRPDFEMFCQTFNKDGYKLFSFDRKNIYINCARVCDMVNTRVKCYTPWAKEDTGIWIDILPIDGIKERPNEFLYKAKEIRSLKNLLYRLRSVKRPFWGYGFIATLKNLYLKMRYGMYDIDKYLDKYQSLVLGDYSSATVCGQLTAPIYVEKEYLPKEWFEEYIELPFEDFNARCVKNYDRLLRVYFNDYMKLPPIEHRQPKHDELTYFWINE